MTSAALPTIRAFGGVNAVGTAGPVGLGGPKQRALLGVLLLEPRTSVPIDRLVDMIWGDTAPSRAEVSIRGYASNLRRALADADENPTTVLPFRDGGYALEVPHARIDLHQFEESVIDGIAARRLGDDQAATAHLTHALGLWTGEPFGNLTDRLDVRDTVARLERRRGDAIETLTDIRLDRGEHVSVAGDLQSEINRDPYRERLRAQLALALYRSGDQVRALRSLDEARRVLVGDIGVRPGPELEALEAAILAHDPALRLTAPPTAVRAAASSALRILPGTPGGPREMIGRQRELDALAGALDSMQSGGRVVMVTGEAGIGKTSLARELSRAASTHGLPTGWGRCTEAASAAAHRPWSAAMRELSAVIASDARSSLDPTSISPSATGDDSASARIHAHLAVIEALRRLEDQVVVVIDDLQWADDATLALLEFVAAEVETLPVLLVVTIRRTGATDLPIAVTNCLAALSRSAGCTSLSLGRLGRADVAEWIDAMVGPGNRPRLVDAALRTTDGNPFYLREFLSLLDSERRLTEEDAVEIVSRVPITVQDVVRRRTSLLPPSTQVTLSTAAVIGRHFDVDLLAASLGVSTNAAGDALSPAILADLIEPDLDHPARFAFAHALVREALVAEQNAVRLAEIHARITVELERLRSDRLELVIDELAHHAWCGVAAGTRDRAVRYALQAADIAERGQASGDAAEHLQRALTLMESSPGATDDERIALMIRLGRSRRDAGLITEGRASLIAAATLAETVGDHPSVAVALDALNADDLWAGVDWSLHDQEVVDLIERVLSRPATPTELAKLSSALAAELVYLDPVRAERLSRAAVEAAERSDDAVLLARTLLQRIWGISGAAHVAARAQVGDRFIELARSSALPDRYVPLAHLARVSAAYETADIDTVRRCRDEAERVIHPARTPSGWAHFLYLETSLALLSGDLDRAAGLSVELEQALNRVRRFAANTARVAFEAVIQTERGNTDEALAWLRHLEPTAFGQPVSWLRAWVLAEGGRHDDAQRALASFNSPLADNWLRVTMSVAGVLAAAAVGNNDFLRRHLPELEPVAHRFACVGNGGIVLGPVAYAIAAGRESLGEKSAALDSAASALDTARRMGAPLWEARARTLLDRLQRG